jgi:transcriptional regulator with XRE-family HTH domain
VTGEAELPRQDDSGGQNQENNDQGKRHLQVDLGKRLSAARQKLGLSIQDVSSKLHIRETYLQGMDSGDWSGMPEEVYVLGFLRQYATLLGENIDQELAQLKSGEYKLTRPFTMPDPPIAPNRAWSISAAIAFVVLIILFNVFNDEDETPVGLPVTVIEPSIEPPGLEPATTEASGVVGEQALTETIARPVIDEVSGLTDQEEHARGSDSTAKPSETSALPGMHVYRFTAVGEDAWIEIFNEEYMLVEQKLLYAGESLSLEHNTGIFVTCGNAAALEISVDGVLHTAAGTMGKPGSVIRNYKVVPAGGDARP